MRHTLILLASTAIILLGLWGSAVIYLDEERLNSIVSSHLGAQSGRKVEIHGSISLRLFPRPRIHAQDVVVAAPDGFDGPRFFTADELSMSVRLLPLVLGNVTPHEVRVNGATVNLYTDEIGRSSVDGLVRSPEAEIRRGAELLSTRETRFEDLRVVINDRGVGRDRAVHVDLVEFDRFAFDEALEFRFRGNLGDPSLLSMMEVEGLLLVPSTREKPVRLSNMRLTGELEGSDLTMQLLGHVSMSSVPVLQLELADGRLDVAGQRLAIEGSYNGGARGYLQVAASAEHLALGGAPTGAGLLQEQLLALFQAFDADIDVRVDELQLHGVNVESLAMRLAARGGQLVVEALEGMIPGGVVSGQGGWQLALDPPQGGLEMDLAVDDFRKTLAAFGLPPTIEGFGQVHWSWLRSPAPTGAGQLAEGRFELWEGRLTMGESDQVGFDRMAGNFMVSPGVFDVPELGLTLPEAELLGWLSVALETGSIGGRLIRVEDGREIGLAGGLDRPELSGRLVPERPPAAASEFANDGLSDGLQ